MNRSDTLSKKLVDQYSGYIKKFTDITKNHREIVARAVEKVIKSLPNRFDEAQLRIQASNHDTDKLAPQMLIPYTIYTMHKYKILTGNVSETEAKMIGDAIYAHFKNSKHHPEYYDHLFKMSKESIVEMVCDWYSTGVLMNNKLKDWIRMNRSRWNFSLEQLKLIDEVANILEP